MSVVERPPTEPRRPAGAGAVASVVAAAVCAGLFLTGTGLHPVWWLTWFAPLPVLVLAPRVSARVAIGVAVVAQLVGMAGFAVYLLTALDAPVVPALGLCLVAGLVCGAATGLYRTLVVRHRPVCAVLAAGATWAGAEYLVAVLSPAGANWTLAVSQSDDLPVLQIVSLTGPWGVAFVLLTTAAGLAVLTAPVPRAGRWRAGAVAGLVLAATVGYGTVRLAAPVEGERVRVSAVAAAAGTGRRVGTPPGDALLAGDLAWVRTHAVPGQLVVFPEKDLIVDDPGLRRVTEQVTAAARNARAVIVLGVEHRGAQHTYNTALVFPADGAEPLVYHKRYPIPGVEDAFTPGDRPAFVPGAPGIGVAICADLGQVSLGRDYGRAGTGVLAVPALDFDVDAWSQSRTQLLRGVENDAAVVRPARLGDLVLADGRGRVVADEPAPPGRTTAVTTDVPSGPGRTPYALAGDWFGWLCVATAVGLATSAAARARRE